MAPRLPSNPVFWREWLRIRRRWYLWIGLLLLAAGIREVYPGLILTRGFGLTTGGFAATFVFPLANLLHVNLFLAIWLTLAGIQRERREGGWEALATTYLTSREILVGKLVFPILSLMAVNLLHVALSLPGFLTTLDRLDVTEGVVRTLTLLAVFGSAQVAGFFYACMACVIVMAVGWRREWGSAALISFSILIGLGFLYEVMFGFFQALLRTFGSLQSTYFFAKMVLIYNLPGSVLEATVALQIYRRLEKRFRSVLAARLESP